MANYLRKGLNRKQYKTIKAYDHKQMEDFVTNIYNEGRNDGITETKTAKVTPADIEKAIAKVRGVGNIKLKAIMQQVYKLYECS